MSFNKLQDFEAQAKELERLHFGDDGKLRQAEEGTTPVSVVGTPSPEPVSAEPKLDEPATAETPKVAVDEEKYKASVKAMNEAQREAAELRKREAEVTREKSELEAKLNEYIRQSKQRPAEVEDDYEADMPEVAKIAAKYSKKSEDRLMDELANLRKRLDSEESIRKEGAKEAASYKMRQAVMAVHPDFDEVVNSDAMQAWVNNEAPPIFKAIYDGSVPFGERDVIAVVSQFKNTLAPAPKASSKPSVADMAAPVRTSPMVSTNAPDDRPITESEYNDFMHNAQRKTPDQLREFEARIDRQFNRN